MARTLEERIAKRALDKALSVEDRIAIILQHYGTREVYITLGDLAGLIGEQQTTTYQALHRLEKKNKIELLKENVDGKQRIVGIKINRLEPTGRIFNRAASKAVDVAIDTIAAPESSMNIPHLTKYLDQKLAIERMRKEAIANGLDPLLIQFPEDPLGEDGITLLQELIKVRKQLGQAVIDRDAAQRDLSFLRTTKRSEPISA